MTQMPSSKKTLVHNISIAFIAFLFVGCSEPSISDDEVIEQDKEAEEKEETATPLEDTSDLPFLVKWGIPKKGDELGVPSEPFLQASEIGLFHYNVSNKMGISSLNKESGALLWNIDDDQLYSPLTIKKIGNNLWSLTNDINDPTVLKIDPNNGTVLQEKKSGAFPSGTSEGLWYGMRRQEGFLYQVDLESANDQAVCGGGVDYFVDPLRNLLFKNDDVILMAVRGGRTMLSINPNTCSLNWELQELDEQDLGIFSNQSNNIDLGSKFLNIGWNYFAIRSYTTGEAELRYPANYYNDLSITQFLHKENDSTFIFHDDTSGNVYAYNWVERRLVWQSQLQSREVGQLFLVQDRLFVYTENQFLYELNMNDGQTLSEREIKQLYPFETGGIAYSFNKVEYIFGEKYFKIYEDEIYYTTEKSMIISARLE